MVPRRNGIGVVVVEVEVEVAVVAVAVQDSIVAFRRRRRRLLLLLVRLPILVLLLLLPLSISLFSLPLVEWRRRTTLLLAISASIVNVQFVHDSASMKHSQSHFLLCTNNRLQYEFVSLLSPGILSPERVPMLKLVYNSYIHMMLYRSPITI